MSAPAGPVIVIGAGGHTHPVLELLDALGVEVAGLADFSLEAAPVLGRRVIVTLDELATLPARGVRAAVVAIGGNAARLTRGDQAKAAGLALPVIIHPAAIVSPSAEIGEGAQVMARGFIGPKAMLGRLALVNTGAIVEHECVVGEAAHVAPGAVLAGGVRIGRLAMIGANAAVIPMRSVGDEAVVGAGGAVVRDVAAGARVGGVPARALR